MSAEYWGLSPLIRSFAQKVFSAIRFVIESGRLVYEASPQGI